MATEVVLIGYHDGRQTCVWCVWCCRWHYHGSSEPGDLRHKAAHCTSADSPYKQGGYWIHTSTRSLAEVRRQVRAAGPAAQTRLLSGRITPGLRRLRAQPVPFVHRVPERECALTHN